MKVWKIINNGKSSRVKITVATGSNTSRGLFLDRDEFCLAKPQMTSIIDIQNRRGVIEIIEDFDNSFGLELGVAYKSSELEKAKHKANVYVS